MRKSIIFLVLLCSSLFGQEMLFRTPGNLKKFGLHLYCNGEYLRASEQFLLLPPGDTVNYLLAGCYIAMDQRVQADEYIAKLKNGILLHDIINERYSSEFWYKHYTGLIEDVRAGKYLYTSADSEYVMPLAHIARFITRTEAILPDIPSGAPAAMLEEARLHIAERYKSPVKAALLAALFPGAGKVYIGRYEDGLMALSLTGLFSWLAYYNSHHGYHTRAWVTGGVAVLLYGSQVYGSYAGAKALNFDTHQEESDKLARFVEQHWHLPAGGELIPCK